MRFLIHYYVTLVAGQTVTCVGPRFEWYPLAVRDEAFFHAVMSSTSSHAAYRQGLDLPRNFFFHRGEAIRLLNEKISSGMYDEGTINTVAVFVQQESWEGRAQGALTHMKGFLQIVSDAGGLHSPALSAKTRRHIFLTDLAATIVLMTKPVLRPTVGNDLNEYFGRPSPGTASYIKTFQLRLYNFTGSPLSKVAANVLWGLRNISELLEAIHEGTESPDRAIPEDIHFTDRVEVLERLAMKLWLVEEPEGEQHAIFRTFGWACVIYIYTILRELPPELGMNPMLAGRIKASLEASPDLNVLLATFQDLLLWQMFICGRVADARDRPFFASNASKILMIRKVESEDEIIVASEGFIWPERLIKLPIRAAVVSHIVEQVEEIKVEEVSDEEDG